MNTIKALFISVLPYVFVAFGVFVVSNALIAVGLYATIMLSVTLVEKGSSAFSEIFKGWLWREGIVFSVLSSFAGISLFFVWQYLQKSGGDANFMLQKFGLDKTGMIIFGLYLIFVNPVLEELFWRHTLHTNTKADIAIDALFAGYHLLVLPFFLNIVGCILAYFVLIVTSFAWRFVKERFGGLAIPVVTHMIADAGIIVFLIYGL